MRRLTRIQIFGLLGRFDHDIDIPEDWEFVILHGPNGVGKTRLLEVIQNTFQFRPHVLADLPFRSVNFAFSDGAILTVSKQRQQRLPIEPASEVEDQQSIPILHYRLQGVQSDDIHWQLMPQDAQSLSPARMRDVERYLPIEQVGPDMWVDQRTDEFLTSPEVLDKFIDHLPPGVVRAIKAPEPLQTFLNDIDVHLIETQRLVTFDRAANASGRPGRRIPQRATVMRFSEDLTLQIARALAVNSRTAQERDRSFPKRVLEQNFGSQVTDDQIRARYLEQSALRTRLAEIDVLDSSTEVPLPERALENWERGVLWTYLDDSEVRLATFQTLLDRLELLREVVNSRFLYKTLQIDSEKGFRFVSDSQEEIQPHQLSSGEQHELVLLYDLLFNVKAKSIVLVDEPEISLHISWQQEFLNDIKRISEIADLQFIIATHSPQIIHTWWERTVALYTPDALDESS